MVDATWLTRVLRAAGVLDTGEVTSVRVTGAGAVNSVTTFVEVTYRGADAPARLVVKRPTDAPWSHRAAATEAAFYRLVQTRPDHPPVLARCLAAGEDYLVLEDLSATHAPPTTRDETIALRGVVDLAVLDAVVDALAQVHAYWWRRDPGSLPVATWWGDADRFTAYVDGRRADWRAVRARVPAPLRDVYDGVLGRSERFWSGTLRERIRGPLTLVHGDTYLSNFLVGPTGAVLLDWQSPEIDIGALDLVTMCATFWTREQRQRYEEHVLRRYHRTLDRPDYAYADLLLDYRIALADWVTVPLRDAAQGSDPGYWLPKLRCLTDAFHDHDVAALFA